ncbi:hypothetical protein WE580_13905 [Citrobacter freundii]|uniref:hypothetical protein n=1 Tax=Citrobacter TaxID=544 RepID=UPI001F0682C0|nr:MULTISPECIES: hypothetical protein [Citrobacter]MDE9714468.1 hypothetical protein [Citrobacter freundii]MDE9724140.1 hypothetical protein [Citrobacter freundii]MDE9734660.1 hypothetical protein [Citrobacter freundii]MEB0918511.1 hypothetical protein [Citrobacter freundii]UMB62595.1 hypothetical protein MJ253_14250 [Citrobacter freundii]
MELQPITPDSLDDEALTDLIEIRKSGVDHHASEGNKVQHAIQSLTLIALVELQQRRDADSSDPIYQWRERYEEGSLWDDCTKAQYDGFAKKTDCEVRILYTAPPAPVSVPAAMEMDDDFDSAFEHGKAVGWNACRAALLQAGNSPVTPDGYVLVPKELTCEMDDAAWGAYHETRCMSDIWAALLAAAPKQEVKAALEHGMQRYPELCKNCQKGISDG